MFRTLPLIALVCAVTILQTTSSAFQHRLSAQQPVSLSKISSPRALVDLAEKQAWSELSTAIENSDSDLSLTQPDGMTALHWAVFHNQIETVKLLLEKGAPVNAATLYQVTPLSIACQHCHAEIASLLLKHHANPESTLLSGETCLMTASRTGNPQIVNDLITHGAKVNAHIVGDQSALMWAAAEGNTATVDVLLKAGADRSVTTKTGFTAFLFAARHGKSEVIDLLVAAGDDVHQVISNKDGKGRKPRDGMSALMFAVESGHFETAVHLIELGADPNDQRSGFAPLHAVTWTRRTALGDNPDGDPPPRGSGRYTSLDFIREIVSKGANVNLQLDTGKAGRGELNTKKATPFLLASQTVDITMMKLLVELGADPNLTNVDQTTPLLAAAGVGIKAVGEDPGTETEINEAIDLLIAWGNDVNAEDANKETAMHGAAYRNFPQVVSFLASKGADPAVWDHKNKYGWTPILIAQGNRPGSFKPSPETVASLEAAKTNWATPANTQSSSR